VDTTSSYPYSVEMNIEEFPHIDVANAIVHHYAESNSLIKKQNSELRYDVVLHRC
jgi:hypothetical protein